MLKLSSESVVQFSVLLKKFVLPYADAEERAYFLKTQAQRRQRHLKGKKHNQMRGQDKVCMGTYYL